ncbi:MAG: uroporphyrinogen-III synthase, partial [Flavobacteriaceae bacterium]|nr:uroporphyrinogen-III synthase [Flavobacteriaceae bacterium]
MRVLSTKILSPSQKELLLNAGLSFVEYNALNVQFLEFEMPPKVENAIFTSQYAIDAVFSK